VCVYVCARVLRVCLRRYVCVTVCPCVCVGGVCWLWVQGLDSTVCYAMCSNGEVWSWGAILSSERAPVGYTRKLVFLHKTVSSGAVRAVCAVCSVQCAVCSVQCAVCSVQCAVCSEPCNLRPTRRSAPWLPFMVYASTSECSCEPRNPHPHVQSPQDAPTVQYARMTPSKIGSTFVGVPAVPIRHAVREVQLTAKEKWVAE
jgi:hypothetical protein